MIRFLCCSLLLLSLSCADNSFAQALPATDIWLLKIENGLPGGPVKISTGAGYNNQPHFSENGSVIYYTREDTENKAVVQTDIAAFDVETATTAILNHTTESEYSPTPIPGRKALSVIQVEADEKQRLWAIDMLNGNMDLLLADVEPVGYHAWINDQEVAMFILGESFTLQTASLRTSGSRVVADNIGRSIRQHPVSSEVLFVDKNSEPWQIAAFNHETMAIRAIMPLFPNSEDFTVDAKGDYWTGNGSKLYKRSPGDSRWQLTADLRSNGVNHISRLAVHLESKQIALVSNHRVAD